MNKEFIMALDELEKERHISKDIIIEALEVALVSAYKKNYGTNENVRVDVDRETGDVAVLMRRDIVDEVFDEMTEMSLEEAREIDPRYDIGDAIEFQVMPNDFGRIAAQTAKQVVVQRIREAERGIVYDNYVEKQGQIATGEIHRISGDTIFVDMGKTEAIMPKHEQVPGENYRVNQRMKFFIMDVRRNQKGPQVFVSRSHPGLVKELFKLEVPEIKDETVSIMSISREAGSRTKMCVYSELEGVDPVGACVGPRGVRVQNVVDELNDEKIDIIQWSEDPYVLISNVLSPAKADEVIIISDDEKDKAAVAVVPDNQLSLAIGKEGQNVRLAAKVSGWKIDIKSHSQYYGSMVEDDRESDLEEMDIVEL